MDERREVSGASEEISLSGEVMESPPWLYDHLPYPRVVFPILTTVAVGYGMLISANPHWVGDLIDVFFAGK